MHKKLQEFINGIKNATGIALSLYNSQGTLLFGEKFAQDLNFVDVKDIYCDYSNGVTLFPISIEGKELIATLNGAGQTEKSLAVFIRDYADKTFSRKELSIEEFFKGLLFGEYDKEQVDKISKKFQLNFSSLFCVYLITEEESMPEVVDFLASMIDGNSDYIILLNGKEGVFIRINNADVDDFVSPKDYANFLVGAIYEETGKNVKIAVGNTVESLIELSQSFSQAKQIAGYGKTDVQKSVSGIEDFFLIKLLEDLPLEKVEKYYKSIRTQGTDEFFNNAELLQTAQAFFENNLNASQTSRKTYLHRNTLNYRLDKVQRLTGLDIRNFYDAVALKTMIIIYRMVNK